MEEQFFYNSDYVAVTNTRFILPSQTFAMANISSVKMIRKERSLSKPLALGFIGIALIIGETVEMGSLVLLLAAIWLCFLIFKSKYIVVLNTAGGENKAYVSKDKEEIREIVSGLNKAIISRGESKLTNCL